MMNKKWNILVTGGAGYVGSVLVPKLLDAGHKVTVLDLYLYGDDVLSSIRGHENIREVKGDLRNIDSVRDALTGCNAVIHLACISNDPSFELNPDLGKSINFDAFRPLVREARDNGVVRFINASSSSVYGIKDVENVTENLPLEPLTDYSKFKAQCEDVLHEETQPGFTTLSIRPATVCGYAPRQRLDVIVNILTNHAVNNGLIKVFGGTQKRPNIHIEDMANIYLHCLQMPDESINGKAFNAGYENHALMDLAAIVRKTVSGNVAIETVPTDDLRSYHISSEKITKELGFKPAYTIEDAVFGLAQAFSAGKLPHSLDDPRYFNIKMMQGINLQ